MPLRLIIFFQTKKNDTKNIIIKHLRIVIDIKVMDNLLRIMRHLLDGIILTQIVNPGNPLFSSINNLLSKIIGKFSTTRQARVRTSFSDLLRTCTQSLLRMYAIIFFFLLNSVSGHFFTWFKHTFLRAPSFRPILLG